MTQGRRPWIPAAIAAATFAAFLPALRNGLLSWDDGALLLENKAYQGFGWVNIKWMFGASLLGNYQPLSWLTYALDYKLWGTDPFGFHLTNLLLHSANAAIFYFAGLRLLSRPQTRAGREERLGAAVAALLFSLHPLRVESVAWATERRDVLSSFFFLLTILLWLRAAEDGETPTVRRLFPAWTAYLLALLSRSMTVTLPAVLVLLDVYPLRRLPADVREWPDRRYRRLWVEKLFFLLPALAFAALALVTQSRTGATVLPTSPGERVAAPLFGLFFYLGKTLWPLRLSPLYERPVGLDLYSWPFACRGAAAAAASLAVFLGRRRRPALLAAWAYYVVTLIPVLGFIPFGRQIAADRYTYLPCLCWPLLAAAGFIRVRRAASPAARRISLALATAVAGVLFALTWRQAGYWRDSETFWRYVASVRPQTAAAHYELGSILTKQGKSPEALEQYRETLEINPAYVHAEYNLANGLADRGDSAEAIAHYRRALLTPADGADAHYNLANLLFKLGRGADAVVEYRAALTVQPRNARAHFNLANTLLGQGALDEALGEYRRATALDPDFADALYNMGAALLRLGRPEEAIACFRRTLEVNPGYAEARNNWGYALVGEGKLEEAVLQYRRALALDPGNAAASANLRAILGRLGRR